MSSDFQFYYLQQMDIALWHERKTVQIDVLKKLEQLVSSCEKCNLCKTRSKTVFSRGNPKAELMIIGEAPGFYEDQQGLPFVGKAGMLLNKMLASIDLQEDKVYIANILKCRPPDNRDPHIDEINECSQYLVQQINLIKPKLLLALGRFAGQFLTKSALNIGQLRQKLHYYENVPCIVSYHPAYLLRNPRDKKKSYEDLLRLKKLL